MRGRQGPSDAGNSNHGWTRINTDAGNEGAAGFILGTAKLLLKGLETMHFRRDQTCTRKGLRRRPPVFFRGAADALRPLRPEGTFAHRRMGGKPAAGFGFATANIFADGVNVVVKPLGVICAVAVDCPNNRIFHNHASDIPINSSGVQMTGRAYPSAAASRWRPGMISPLLMWAQLERPPPQPPPYFGGDLLSRDQVIR